LTCSSLFQLVACLFIPCRAAENPLRRSRRRRNVTDTSRRIPLVDGYTSYCHSFYDCYYYYRCCCSRRLLYDTRFLFLSGLFLHLIAVFLALVQALNDRLFKRFSELSRLATNSECIDQLMDLLRMQNSMDEILTLISQATSPQVHARIAELLHTLLNVSDRTTGEILADCPKRSCTEQNLFLHS
jgi:hypothetical protein